MSSAGQTQSNLPLQKWSPGMKKKVSGCACQGANIEKFIQPVILSILKKETLTGYGVVKKMQDYSMFRFEQPDIAGVYKYLKNMEANLVEFAKCNPDNTQLESDIDNRFHLTVARATENPFVIITMEPVHNLLPRMRNFIYANIDGEKEITLGYHKEIVNAIRERDADRAYDKMQAHLDRNMQVYNKFFKNS